MYSLPKFVSMFLTGLVLSVAASTFVSAQTTSGAPVTSCNLTSAAPGSRYNVILTVQKILNADPNTQIAEAGPGSPGMETTYFGVKTQTALVKFQELYSGDILTPQGLTQGTGFLGKATLAKMSAICGTLTADGSIGVKAGTTTPPLVDFNNLYKLSISVAGKGTVSYPNSTIASKPNSCTGSCATAYYKNSKVTLTATAQDGYLFSGWSGSCSGKTICSLTMDRARSVGATFSKIASPVPPTPAAWVKIANEFEVFSIIGSANKTVHFGSGTSWVEKLVATSGECTVAFFGSDPAPGTAKICEVWTGTTPPPAPTPVTFTLNATVLGSGNVTSVPAGISCDGSCSASYTQGTSVTLTATPAANFALTGWTGDCSGTQTCTVSMSQARSVTATFTKIPAPLPTLTFTSTPSGNTSVLNWSSTNAVSCTASGAWSGTKATSGTATVIPLVSSTYTLLCTNEDGVATPPQSVVVTVVPPAPIPTPTGSISSATGCSIAIGASNCSGMFSWSVLNGTTPKILDNDVVFSTSATGVNVTKSLAYGSHTIVLSNAGNTLDTKSLTVTCATGATWNGSACVSTTPTGTWQKVANEFEVFAISGTKVVSFGSAATGGGWTQKTFTSADSCSSYTFGKDPAPNLAKICEIWTGSLPAPTRSNGTTPPTPTPPAPTVPDPTITFTGTPSGSSTTLTWTTTNAVSCTASGAWSGTKATSGTQSVTPTVTSTYTLTCLNSVNASASQGVTVVVSGTPSPAWTAAASEFGVFSVTGTKTVRFGKNNGWTQKAFTGTVICASSSFGNVDPNPGVAKVCELWPSDTVPAPVSPSTPDTPATPPSGGGTTPPTPTDPPSTPPTFSDPTPFQVPASVLGITACLPGSGTDYQVGPNSGQLSSLDQVPWESLKAGDTVRVFYKSTPYYGKFLITGKGTADAPIRVCGVKGPNGERPMISGQNAITRRGTAYGNIAHEQRGIIMIKSLSTQPYEYFPTYIQVDGLKLQDVQPSYTFTDASGAKQPYWDFGACIWVERGQNVLIADNEITNCTHAIFSRSQEFGDFAVTKNVRIAGNNMYDDGVAGSYTIHTTYTQSKGIIYEFNRFGPAKSGATGNALKDRSTGTIIRYNRIEDGAHAIDLVEAEDFPDTAKADPAYRSTYVYGNEIIKDSRTGSTIHYGGDHAGSEGNYRKGTLYFFNNTVRMKGQAATPVFQLSTTEEKAEVWNNVFTFDPGTQFPSMRGGQDVAAGYTTGGLLNFGKNWITTGWADTDPYHPIPVASTGVANIITGSTPPITLTTGVPLSGSSILGVGQEGPSAASGYKPMYQLRANMMPEVRSGSGAGSDLGAVELQ